jgi:hypothetical protein
MRARLPRRSGGTISARLREIERTIAPRPPRIVFYRHDPGMTEGEREAAVAEALSRHIEAWPSARRVMLAPELVEDETHEEWQRRFAPDWARGLPPVIIGNAAELREHAAPADTTER